MHNPTYLITLEHYILGSKVYMNKKIISFAIALSALSLLYSCSDEIASSSDNNINAIVTDVPVFYYDGADTPLLITGEGVVKDTAGNVIGTADIYAGVIVDVNGNPIAEGVNFGELDIISPTVITDLAWVMNADQNYVIYPNGVVTDAAGNQVGTIVFGTDPETGAQISTGNIIALDGVSVLFEGVDVNELPVHGANVAPPPPSSASEPVPESSSVYEQPPVSSVTVESSSSIAHSSSSRMSSSSARSSSSAKSSSSSQQQVLLPKVISGAQTKSGYATRYWDSCKPHCAWEGKGGPVARTCKADGTSRANSDENSVCDGGSAGTCFDQTPQIVNDTIAYAFAATPGGGNDCGKCYMLTFKGTGASATNTPTDSHHKKIKGKHLIVMSSNIGYDVSHNQFDLMIPGGGPGAFNGCQKMGISCAGAQYGGFLTTCNYKKDCLINMCNQEYSNNTSLKNGCLFLANWMDAANNPEVDFVEVECPQALKDKY